MSGEFAISLTTSGGVSLNPAGNEYETCFMAGQVRVVSPDREELEATRDDDGATWAGSRWKSRVVQVKHTIAGTGSTHETNLHKLKAEHYTSKLGQPVTLVFVDVDGVTKEATWSPIGYGPVGDTDGHALIGTWRLYGRRALVPVANATSTANAAKTSSPATVSVANAGDDHTSALTFNMSSFVQKGATESPRYRYPITPVNRNPWPIARLPWCLTDDFGGSAGWDHAAEVTATRSTAAGDDVEVYVNHRRVSRWADAFNGAATRVWINLDMPAGRWWTMAHGATLGAADVTVQVLKTGGALLNMPPLPFYAAFVEGSGTQEVVLVTALDEATATFTIDRAERGTTAFTHVDGSRLYLCPVLVDLVYGQTTGADNDYIDDAEKPMLNLGSSDNASFVWADFAQYVTSGNLTEIVPRTAAWSHLGLGLYDREKTLARGDQYWNYLPWSNGIGADAATAASMSLGYRNAGARAGHPLADRWTITLPIGGTQIAFTQTTTTLDFATNREAYLTLDGTSLDGAVERIDSYDGDTASAETETPLGNVYTWTFRIRPFDPKVDSNTVEILAGEPAASDGWTVDGVTITLDSSEEILALWGTARENIYQIGRPDAPATLANSQGVTLKIPGLVVVTTATLAIDLAARTATLNDGRDVAAMFEGLWPEAPPGTTNLTYTETNLELTLGVTGIRAAWAW